MPVHSYSQWSDDLSNKHSRTVNNQQDSFFLHYHTIIESSLQLESTQTTDIPSYRIGGNYFIWNQSTSASDTIFYTVSFRVMPINLERWHSRFDSVMYRDGRFEALEPILYDPNQASAPIIRQEGLKYDGNFSRGLSLGNRQDLVLNSNFDLRMAGPIGEDIEILAALSDNSIPLQPEGNTQQLQEFDRIFIQLSKGPHTLTGGDYELKRPKGHFMNYFKRTQGAKFSTTVVLDQDRTLSSSVSIAGSKGKFARINIAGLEGNQGPYRLRGVDGEQFIIVLAGSERIYIDGQLMQRGLEKDYTIDYNAGEVFFTPKQIITKDKRIIAEYEYSVQSYNRSIYTAEIDYQTKGFGLHFNAYSEQDGIASAGLVELTTEDKRFLAELGDSTSASFVSSVRRREEGFDPNIVMYQLVDTLGFDDVLVRSTDPALALYTARFLFVGQNQGNYVQIATESNGEVYAWVAPDPFIGPQGTHEPRQLLIAPQQLQMFTVGGQVTLGQNGLWTSETAFSKKDLNRFSERDATDDFGMAINNQLTKSFTFGTKQQNAAPWSLHTKVMHEMVQKTFSQLKPYRVAEFSRDWNLSSIPRTNEHLADVEVRLSRGASRQFSYRYGGLFRGSEYEGHRHMGNVMIRSDRFTMLGTFNQLSSQSQLNKTTFLRPKLDISHSLDKQNLWRMGFYFEEERNAVTHADQDTLLASSFYYDMAKLYLSKQQGKKLNLQVAYQKRWDYQGQGTHFALSTLANDFTLGGRWAEGSKSILDGNLTIRNLDILREGATSGEAGQNYLGRITHALNLGEGFIRTNTTYQVSSGQEPKRTFQYLKVDPGLGVYTFIDVNGDGLQQVNEFEVAAFQEQAEYVRVTVLTSEFIPTNNIIYNQSYSIDPQRLKTPGNTWWSKFSNQGSIRIERKNLKDASASLWNPFSLDIADSSLINIGSQLRNVLYFNRSNPQYDLQWEKQDVRNRLALTTGFESRRVYKDIFRARLNIKRSWTADLSVARERNIQDSENFDLKDFQIEGWETIPELTFQPSSKFRLAGKYRYFRRENSLEKGGQVASANDVTFESVWNQAATSILRFNLSMVLINFEGSSNPALEFTMLEGLKDGTNWIWGLSYDRRLANNIRINVSYDGRKSGLARVVHTARAQVSAFF